MPRLCSFLLLSIVPTLACTASVPYERSEPGAVGGKGEQPAGSPDPEARVRLTIGFPGDSFDQPVLLFREYRTPLAKAPNVKCENLGMRDAECTVQSKAPAGRYPVYVFWNEDLAECGTFVVDEDVAAIDGAITLSENGSCEGTYVTTYQRPQVSG